MECHSGSFRLYLTKSAFLPHSTWLNSYNIVAFAVGRYGGSTPSTTCCTCTATAAPVLFTVLPGSSTRLSVPVSRKSSTDSSSLRCLRFTPMTSQNHCLRNCLTKICSSSPSLPLSTRSRKPRRRRSRRRCRIFNSSLPLVL